MFEEQTLKQLEFGAASPRRAASEVGSHPLLVEMGGLER